MKQLDPTQLKDWQIAAAAEAWMKPFGQLGAELGLRDEELIPMGRSLGRVDHRKVWQRLGQRPQGRYIDVTAITSTPLGEGKTTVTIGLIQALAKLGKSVTGAIRQPSCGPTFNIKGSAAGGGLAQCIPLAPFSIRLTGDIDAITNAHNLAMVALTARMQHEHNYDDDALAARSLKRLDIDPARVQMKWAIDFCAQALRHITIGRGGKMDGLEMPSGFQISVSSELMTILAMANDLPDLRRRIGRIAVAYSKSGRPVTTADLEVDGAMTAWLVESLNPTLIQTLEGQPVFVHAGPFANIALGQSSVIADKLGTRLADYHVTESGFGADMGYEKFWNLKCRHSGLHPDCVVIVATIRSLKMHGGGPIVKPGLPLDRAYTQEHLELLEKGFQNLLAHIDIVAKSGIRPLVCLNRFHTDTEGEIALVRRLASAAGARVAVSNHWAQGGDGALELAEAVAEACEEPSQFKPLYDPQAPLRQRLEAIAVEIYGADGISYSDRAGQRLAELEQDPKTAHMGVCMAKTQLSLSHDPALKGRPTGWTLPIDEVLVYYGADLVVPVAGGINLLPGTGSDPAFRRIDVDLDTGKVTGLF